MVEGDLERKQKKSQMLGDKAEINEADVLTADGAYSATSWLLQV